MKVIIVKEYDRIYDEINKIKKVVIYSKENEEKIKKWIKELEKQRIKSENRYKKLYDKQTNGNITEKECWEYLEVESTCRLICNYVICEVESI
jgi:hypothetical protein